MEGNEAEDDDIDDLITLDACGQITKYRFPQNVTRCPIVQCKESFEFRSAGIEHFKEKHAKTLIMCPICIKPVSAPTVDRFVHHCRDKHPQEKIPFDFSNQMPEDEDETIILRGCDQITHWQFPPDTTRCPIRSCQKEFGVRFLAISHFKAQHAKKSVYCSICERPIPAKTKPSLVSHYTKFHEDDTWPEYLKKPESDIDEVKCLLLSCCVLLFICIFRTIE